MATVINELLSRIQELPDEEKLRLVAAILTDLEKADGEVTRVWAEEARKRWEAYKAGNIPTVSYEKLMSKYER